MTALETIKFVAESLAAQGCRSEATQAEADEFDTPIGSCLYRGPKGRKCGAGWLIPDPLYNKSMENRSIVFICVDYPEVSKAMMPSDLQEYEGRILLSRIQNIHDNFAVDRWAKMFEDLDAEYATRTEAN